ncbi:MAG: hypothetical protein OXC71_09545 [Chloroflexi bacterium]|nr:hypothetical protein [Chloroflexota bacterium]
MDKPVLLDSSYSASQLAGAFTVRVNDVSQAIKGASVSGRDIRPQIEHRVAGRDTLAVDYRKGRCGTAPACKSRANHYGTGN